MGKLLSILILIQSFSGLCFGQTESLTLQEAEAIAIEKSAQLRGSSFDFEAAEAQANAQHSLLLPQLSLEANYRYLTEVPEPLFLPQPVPFGSHSLYSIGPTLRYTLFDLGANRNTYLSLKILADAQEAVFKQVKQEILTRVRFAYVRLQLASEELQLVQEALTLAQRQAKDIESSFRAGAASRLERISSRREVSSYELQLSQAQSALDEAALDLDAILGRSLRSIESSRPLELEPLSKSSILLSGLDSLKSSDVLASNPRILSQSRQAESARFAAKSAEAGYWPNLRFEARTSLDYPNGPVLEQIHQTTVGVMLSMPILDWSRTRNLVAQRRLQASSLDANLEQTQIDIKRDWEKAIKLIGHLEHQKQVAIRSVQDAEVIARLNYLTYRAGRINFTEVQSANFRLLETRVSLARIDANLINQAIRLRSLAGQDVRTE